MPKKRYVCSIIRFSPSPYTGEFINVGVIVGNDEEGYKARSVKSAKRAILIDDKGQLENPDVRQRLLGYAESIVTERNLTEQGLARMAGSTGNAMSSFQITVPIPGLEWNIDASLDYCFETFVIEPEGE